MLLVPCSEPLGFLLFAVGHSPSFCVLSEDCPSALEPSLQGERKSQNSLKSLKSAGWRGEPWPQANAEGSGGTKGLTPLPSLLMAPTLSFVTCTKSSVQVLLLGEPTHDNPQKANPLSALHLSDRVPCPPWRAWLAASSRDSV